MPSGAIPFPFGDCRVCSDHATGVHYGVATCEGCKGFFKRSLPKAHKYRCFHGDQCVVSPLERNRCKACRFRRCLTVGMSIEGVKMGRIPKVDKERALELHFLSGGCSTGPPFPSNAPPAAEATPLSACGDAPLFLRDPPKRSTSDSLTPPDSHPRYSGHHSSPNICAPPLLVNSLAVPLTNSRQTSSILRASPGGQREFYGKAVLSTFPAGAECVNNGPPVKNSVDQTTTNSGVKQESNVSSDSIEGDSTKAIRPTGGKHEQDARHRSATFDGFSDGGAYYSGVEEDMPLDYAAAPEGQQPLGPTGVSPLLLCRVARDERSFTPLVHRFSSEDEAGVEGRGDMGGGSGALGGGVVVGGGHRREISPFYPPVIKELISQVIETGTKTRELQQTLVHQLLSTSCVPTVVPAPHASLMSVGAGPWGAEGAMARGPAPYGRPAKGLVRGPGSWLDGPAALKAEQCDVSGSLVFGSQRTVASCSSVSLAGGVPLDAETSNQNAMLSCGTETFSVQDSLRRRPIHDLVTSASNSRSYRLQGSGAYCCNTQSPSAPGSMEEYSMRQSPHGSSSAAIRQCRVTSTLRDNSLTSCDSDEAINFSKRRKYDNSYGETVAGSESWGVAEPPEKLHGRRGEPPVEIEEGVDEAPEGTIVLSQADEVKIEFFDNRAGLRRRWHSAEPAIGSREATARPLSGTILSGPIENGTGGTAWFGKASQTESNLHNDSVRGKWMEGKEGIGESFCLFSEKLDSSQLTYKAVGSWLGGKGRKVTNERREPDSSENFRGNPSDKFVASTSRKQPRLADAGADSSLVESSGAASGAESPLVERPDDIDPSLMVEGQSRASVDRLQADMLTGDVPLLDLDRLEGVGGEGRGQRDADGENARRGEVIKRVIACLRRVGDIHMRILDIERGIADEEASGVRPIHPLNRPMALMTHKHICIYWNEMMSTVPRNNSIVTSISSNIPGFKQLDVCDQIRLLEGAYCTLWMIIYAPLFWGGDSYLRLTSEVRYSRDWLLAFFPDKLVERIFSFVEELNRCLLTPTELMLLCALQLTNEDDLKLKAPERVRRLHDFYLDLLAYEIERSHAEDHSTTLIKVFQLLPLLGPMNQQQLELISQYSVYSPPVRAMSGSFE